MATVNFARPAGFHACRAGTIWQARAAKLYGRSDSNQPSLARSRYHPGLREHCNLTGSSASRAAHSASDQALRQTLLVLTQTDQHTRNENVAGLADLDALVIMPVKAPVSHLLLPIFLYHHICSLLTTNLLDFSLTVTTDFDAQLNWLQREGSHTITMTELFDTFSYARALPARSMLLTFVDGYAYALPTLLAHHYHGGFSILTDLSGKPGTRSRSAQTCGLPRTWFIT